MQEHEYKARDKTVCKMNRDGLTEVNLHSWGSVRVSQREKEEWMLSKQAEDDFSLRPERAAGKKPGAEKGRRRRRYITDQGEKEPSFADGKPDEPVFDGEAKRSPQLEPVMAENQEWPEPDGEGAEIREGAEESGRGITEHSLRSGNIRGHPAGRSAYGEAAAETSHVRKKRMVQDYARKKKAEQPAMEDFREEIKDKTKREQVHKEQKKSSRLSFGDEETGMVRGAGMGISKKAVSAAAGSAAVYVHGKAHEAEEENAALEGSHRAELMAENALRYAMGRTSRGMHKRSARLKESSAVQMEKGRLLYETAQETGKKAAQETARRSRPDRGC